MEITKTRRIYTITERISEEEATLAEIQAVEEELSTLLGQVLDTKIAVKGLIDRLED